MIFTLGSVSAENMNTTQSEALLVENANLSITSYAYVDTIANGQYNLHVNVKDSFNESNTTWDENGHPIANAKVNVYDSSNKLLYSGLTDNFGDSNINILNSGSYNVVISYSTYKSSSYSINFKDAGSVIINHVFYPDIVLLMSYSAHSEKINVLMNLSRRVAYIDTVNYEKEKQWILDIANYVHLDMYADTYNFKAADLLKDSPANKNFKIAYTFGVYKDDFISGTSINFLGATSSKNTPNTLENTYIGSYFQALDTPDVHVMEENMKNYLAYVKYLLEPTVYENPTLDPTRTPLVASTAGIYHPDYGTLTFAPSQRQINQWIIANPGYTVVDGSLNWMVKEYAEWQTTYLNPADLIITFEKWYEKNIGLNNSYVVVVSYYAGGELVDTLIRQYESQGRSCFNLYQSVPVPSASSMLVKMQAASKYGIVAVNSLYSWSLNYNNLAANGATDDLAKLDVVVLRAVDKISNASYSSPHGPQIEWTYSVTIPSFEGVFGAVVVSYLDPNSVEHIILPGVKKLIDQTLGWIKLKEKNNSEKIVSIVLYNYPPGKGEIGASYLDIFQSVHDLLELLSDEGYNVGMKKEDLPSLDELTELITQMGNKGSWVPGLLNEYVEKNWDSLMAHGQLVDLNKYYELIANMNEELRQKFVHYWGDGLGKIMVYKNDYILIPGMFFGNIFITFQPSRGWEEVADYHNTNLPPHQQYITFYKWLDQVLQTDAIINMGTHGTLEFLPGRSIGLQENDWSFELTVAPTIYPYIVSNPGEGMVAKDRLGSLIITHMTPAIAKSPLYGNYTTLNDYIARYHNAIKNNASDLAVVYKEFIINLAIQLNYTGPENNESFDTWLENLHNSIDEIADDFNALGLHTLGLILSGKNLTHEVITIVSSKTDVYNQIVDLLYPELASHDFYEYLKKHSKYNDQVKVVEDWFSNFVSNLVNGTGSCADLAAKYGVANNTSLYDSLLYCVETIINLQNNHEWKSLLSALNGSYVYAGLFADPSYGDSIPTGTNGYATDTSKMPSKAAYLAAVKIVNLILVNYYEQNGKWPELIGLILWGTEILRTEGIGVAEFLYFLGCKPIWSTTGKIVGFEVIPLENLTVTLSNGNVVNRPRVDVYASMVTSNINWISLMVNAVNAVYYNTTGEDSSVNFVKKHYEQYPSLNRLFGLPGAILEGTGLSDYIPNTNKWKNDTNIGGTLADIYLDRVSYAWTLDEKGNIVVSKDRNFYSYLLSKVDIITQNIDSTWRFLDSDDYYDWFGGMYLASNILGGKPNTAIVDIRNQNNYILRDLFSELNLEIRSNILNPYFRDALLSTSAGWLEYASKFENIFGFETASYSSTGKSIIGDGNYNLLANNMLEISGRVDSSTTAASWQSMAGWLIYSYSKGYWSADSATITKLANTYIEITVKYGVACCHHTCANLDFSKLLMEIGTVSPEMKQKYSDILQSATLSDAVYNSNQSGDNTQGNSTDDSEKENTQTNGATDENNNGNSGVSNGIASVGLDSSQPLSHSSGSSSSSRSSGSSGASSSAGKSSDSYEVSKATSSSSSNSSSMPVYFVIAVIILVILFAAGYLRGKNKED